ncbi:MAG: YkgJ family cysteine cluster protein [Firmicutes bacterium]|nr:YkgJ family cysteine cluster protein [Bacillota bacterium]
MAVELIPVTIEGETGLDVRVHRQEATVSDLIAAMQLPADDPKILKPFHKQRYAVCRGCVNNCCKYNPIVIDLVAAERLARHHSLNLMQFARQYLALTPDLPYPELRRRPCPFLRQNCCTVYEARALICRLYLCTPMTTRLEKLRCAVLLAGEAALQQRLVELGVAPRSWQPTQLMAALKHSYRAGKLTPEAYRREREQLDLLLERNPFLDGCDYDEVCLRQCCTEDLWQTIFG